MPRAALILLVGSVVSGVTAVALATDVFVNPHMNPGVVPGQCSSCHEGHGEPRSPMLGTSQSRVCLSCHGSEADRDRQVVLGNLAADARPPLLDNNLALPYQHPIMSEAFSRHDVDSVTCTSCHSPHRSSPEMEMGTGRPPQGRRRLSPRNPSRFEFELCQECHGSSGAAALSLVDISRLFSPESRSYHPVEAPSKEGSPSVIPALAGREISCTDCHGSSNRNGPQGVHGSANAYVLRSEYATADGYQESPMTYTLCYSCHSRNLVLDGSAFSEHGDHVIEGKASCATCHNPHGSVTNRALIRFGEETSVGGVSLSFSTGRLEFVSDGPGSGACYLTCHGVDHGPEAYGALKLQLDMLGKTALPRARVTPDPASQR